MEKDKKDNRERFFLCVRGKGEVQIEPEVFATDDEKPVTFAEVTLQQNNFMFCFFFLLVFSLGQGWIGSRR